MGKDSLSLSLVLAFHHFLLPEEEEEQESKRAPTTMTPIFFSFEIKQTRWLIIIIVEQARAVRYWSRIFIRMRKKNSPRIRILVENEKK